MEESLRIDGHIREVFGIEGADIRTYSPLTLAFIGDSIYDLVIRTIVVGKGNTTPSKLHHACADLVKASAQAKLMDYLEPELTEEEEKVFRRGRNAHSATTAKNMSTADYRRATGFEALLGYLYLTDQTERLLCLVRMAIERNQAHE